MTRRLLLPLVAASSLLLAGCGFQLGAPPVEVLYRESLLGQGLIVQIKNTSDRQLTEIQVEVRGPDGERRSYTEDSLEGYDFFEVGWKRLGGWQIPPDSTVTVKAKGYVFPARAEVDDE